MSPDEIFLVWCPPTGRWPPWVKPVLFSFVSSPSGGQGAAAAPQESATSTETPPWDLTGLPKARENVALVLDLPGGEAVRAAMASVPAGFRPVPLYNALPWDEASGLMSTDEHRPVVDMVDVVLAL